MGFPLHAGGPGRSPWLAGVVAAAVIAATLVPAGTARAAGSLVQVLRGQVGVQRQILQRAIRDLEQQQADLREAWSRVERLSADFLRAQKDGESAESLRLRDDDLRQAEGDLLMRLFACQQLRGTIAAARDRLGTLEEELARLEGSGETEEDPLSGRWRLVMEPGGQKGEMALELNGTLLEGTYFLDGGWFGSLRGTFVAGKVRLERVDSQLGFMAVYYGELKPGRPSRLEGTWEGTHLSAGIPSGGTWIAERIEDESEESGYPEP